MLNPHVFKKNLYFNVWLFRFEDIPVTRPALRFESHLKLLGNFISILQLAQVGGESVAPMVYNYGQRKAVPIFHTNQSLAPAKFQCSSR